MKRIGTVIGGMLFGLLIGRVQASTLLQGVEPAYAGQVLRVYTEMDGITQERCYLDSCVVDSTGHFALHLPLQQVRKCSLHLGYYTGSLFLCPDSLYTINLPPLRPLTQAEQLNPYFRPQEVLLSLTQPRPDDLNLRIAAFDEEMDAAWQRLAQEGAQPGRIEQAIDSLEAHFGGEEDAFFTDYKEYNYAQLVNLYEPDAPYLSIDHYFYHRPPVYNNPAWWEAFAQLFERFDCLEQIQENPALYELTGTYLVKQRLLPLAWLQRVQSPEVKPIADRLRKNLQPSDSTVITQPLIDMNGTEVDLSTWQVPKIYVLFANSAIRECQADLTYVKKMEAKRNWKERCAFLVVFSGEDRELSRRSVARYRLQSPVVSVADNPGLEQAFRVCNLPSYYVITPAGRLLESPAPAPVHFEP